MQQVRIFASFVALLMLGVLAVPAWAGNTFVGDASSFGTAVGQLGTATFSNVSSNPCLLATTTCNTVVYTVDIASQAFVSGGTYTYVYGLTLETATNYSCTGTVPPAPPGCGNPVTSPNNMLTLSSLSIGSAGFDLTLNYGTVGTCTGICGGITGYTTTGGTSFAGMPTVTSTSTIFANITNLGVGMTLLVYAQSLNAPLLVSASTLDGGNTANSFVAGPSTPEPTSMALLGSGVALMAGFLRKRRSKL
jgi:hypothetical protein